MTGDLGYVDGGVLYVADRLKDIIIHAGMNVYPAALEAAAGDVPGVRKGRVVAFGVTEPTQGTEGVVVAAEVHRGRRDLDARVRAAVARKTGIVLRDVVLLDPGTLPLTTSGKLMRSRVRERFLADELEPRRLRALRGWARRAFRLAKKLMLRRGSAAMRVLVFSGVLGVSLLGAATAWAQNAGFTVNRYEPSERGSHWFVTESLDLRGELRPAIGVVGDYQYRPLAIYDANGDVRSSIVRHMFTAHVGGSLVLADRFRFALSLPVVPYVEGEDGRLRGVNYAAPANETTLGDLRIGVDARLFGRADDPVTVGVGAQAWLPTGDRDSYTSDGNMRFAPRVLVAGALGAFTYAAKAGVMIRAEELSFADATVGHDLMFGASAGVRVADRRWVIGPELFGTTTLASQAFEKRTTPLEVLLGTHYAFEGGLRVGAGVGPGLTRGYGSPVVRALAVVEWMPDVSEDADGDGIPDSEDACPTVKGVRSADPERNGCPAPPKPSDRDGDGILDVDDACPDDAGVRTSDKRTNGCTDRDGDGIYDPLDACIAAPGIPSEDPKLNGCPDPDRDKDGVPNAEDACPDEPGVRTQDKSTNGCPDLDRDKDGILNAVDACPDEPGKPHPDPKKNGCPQAFVSGDQIVILEQVKFKTASAEILPGKDSEDVLQAVLKVLKDHPEISKVRVEGHTDNKGAAALNKKLSADRAASVVKWLTKNGVDKARLSSAGFGPDKPIDTNATDAGRQNNRRVEFHIESGAPASKP